MRLTCLVLLRSSRIGHVKRCIGAALGLFAALEKLALLDPAERPALKGQQLPRLLQSADALAKQLDTERHFVEGVTRQEAHLANELSEARLQALQRRNVRELRLSPHFLLFEFLWNIVLRRNQCRIITNLQEAVLSGRSKVKQMLMGQGKTTVVGPLLSLLLADSERLVVSVVPKALLEMSVLHPAPHLCERRREAHLHAELRPRSGGDQVDVPGAHLHGAEPRHRRRDALDDQEPHAVLPREPEQPAPHPLRADGVDGEAREAAAERAALLEKIIRLLREARVLLDEVDLLLHPLKSETNFPINGGTTWT